MTWSFEQLIFTLQDMGVADVVLPFLIVFTIIYAALQKSKVLGRDSKKFNIIVALVMGLSVVVPHVLGIYPPYGDIVDIMNRALPNVSLIAIAIVMVMLILGIVGGEVNFAGTSLGGIAIWGAIIAVALIFIGATGAFTNMPWWLYWTLDPYVREVIVVVLVFGIIIYFITKDDKDDKTAARTMGQSLQDLTKIWGGGPKK